MTAVVNISSDGPTREQRAKVASSSSSDHDGPLLSGCAQAARCDNTGGCGVGGATTDLSLSSSPPSSLIPSIPSSFSFGAASTLNDVPICCGGGPSRTGGFGAAVSTGTTIMAVTFEGGVVLGADSRTSAGSFIVNRAARKISRLHDRLFVCRSGSAADTQALTQIVKLHIQQHSLELGVGKMPRVSAAASLFRRLSYEYKEMLSAGLLIAGYDDVAGGQVFAVPVGGSMLRVPYSAGGSGSIFVMGLIDARWKPGMNEEECRDFVKKCVAHAIARDGSSGGMIRLITVKKEGVNEECILGENVDKILAESRGW